MRSSKIRAACLQNDATPDWSKTFVALKKMLREALCKKADFVCLPEFFMWRGGEDEFSYVSKQISPFALSFLRQWAKDHQVAVLAGSILESVEEKSKSAVYENVSYLIHPSGRIAAKYPKIHLFDVTLKRLKHQESEGIRPGKEVVLGSLAGRKVGMSICYDLRFPELYRYLSQEGAEILTIPANFTKTTGKDHWKVLVQARAIENQAFVLAPGQCGANRITGLKSYGHSMIVDPWGNILAEASGSREEVIWADLDFAGLKKLRARFPALKHRKMRVSSYSA